MTPHLLLDDPAQHQLQHPQLQARVRDGLGDGLWVLDEQLVTHRPENTRDNGTNVNVGRLVISPVSWTYIYM